MHSYQGHPPPVEGWEKVSDFQDEAEGAWGVYRQRQKHSTEWETYKVAAAGRVPGKANYWFALNHATKQIGFGRDLHLMRAVRPKLYGRVMDLVEAAAAG